VTAARRLARDTHGIRRTIEFEGTRTGPAGEIHDAHRIPRIDRAPVSAHRDACAEHVTPLELQATDVLVAAHVFERGEQRACSSAS
jgi:hypothetical protein